MSRTASMQGKVVVITGATSGIGERAAERLAAMGARLVLVARSKERSEATLGRLAGIAPEAKHRVHYADLSLMAETRRAAREIVAAEPRIDVLINNAGAIFSRRRVTSEGLEQTFALNHMSYFGADGRAARGPGVGCTDRQHGIGSPSECAIPPRKSAVGTLPSIPRLRSVQALQHSVHA